MLSRSLMEKWQFSPGVRLEPQNVAYRERETERERECISSGRARTPVD